MKKTERQFEEIYQNKELYIKEYLDGKITLDEMLDKYLDEIIFNAVRCEMIKRKTWEEFKESKLLWFVNTILHAFGWAIVTEVDNDTIINVYPARVKFRGFSEKINAEGYIGLSEYMKENCEELLKEAKE